MASHRGFLACRSRATRPRGVAGIMPWASRSLQGPRGLQHGDDALEGHPVLAVAHARQLPRGRLHPGLQPLCLPGGTSSGQGASQDGDSEIRGRCGGGCWDMCRPDRMLEHMR